MSIITFEHPEKLPNPEKLNPIRKISMVSNR